MIGSGISTWIRSSLLARFDLSSMGRSLVFWGLAVSALGLCLALSNTGIRWRRLGHVIGGLGLVLLAIALPKLSDLSTVEKWTQQIVFWLLSGMAIGCSAAAVTARNPVYTAIWFAASLLGVAGLFLFQNAQFLGVATIVVYAGAIIVTFLFVLMLANPEGQANYDRISWAKFPVPLLVLSGAALVAFAAISFFEEPPPAASSGSGTLASSDHMAHLGGELFAKHLVSVEVVGTILLVALVGAVAIVIQGRERRVASSMKTDSILARRNA